MTLPRLSRPCEVVPNARHLRSEGNFLHFDAATNRWLASPTLIKLLDSRAALGQLTAQDMDRKRNSGAFANV